MPAALRSLALALPLLALGAAFGCDSIATHSVNAGTGPRPVLPEPAVERIPTTELPRAVGWSDGLAPTPAAGLRVSAYARGLDHPRWLLRLPNGDVLVAETNAPAERKNARGLKGLLMKLGMKRTGGAVPSPNRIRLLRDGDGAAERSVVFLDGLNSPFGMALVGENLYVANTDALVRVRYAPGQTRAIGEPEPVAELPAGAVNHHWTKNVVASARGDRLYVTVGSNSNVGESGLELERGRALILEVDPATGASTPVATGLRNPNGLAWHPESGALWTTVNERDELGSDLVPDYLTAVKRGGFYGWPYSYYGRHIDPRVEPQRPGLVRAALVPDYALGPHTAALGLAFAEGECLPERFREGAFVGLHGSWNRNPPSGYKVVFVRFDGERPLPEPPVDVLTGFLGEEGDARGRPVGVTLDATGSLLVADDVGNTIWRVTSAERDCAAGDGKRPETAAAVR
jgi:glucose/arabinose dehydrogenase